MTSTAPLTKKAFKSDQEVRWCPGCGDYGILNSVQSAFAKLGKSLENVRNRSRLSLALLLLLVAGCGSGIGSNAP